MISDRGFADNADNKERSLAKKERLLNAIESMKQGKNLVEVNLEEL